MSIEDLAASIARRGLIQSISVVPILDADGRDTGLFEVPAGGRRFRALELLIRQKRLSRTTPIPCIVRERDATILVEEISLAENIERAPLHPLDQYRAFEEMRAKGRSDEDIAAAFFVPVQVVKQRLRLASVSPVLLDLYADDRLTLDQLMAFSVSDDHARQEQVWEAIKDAWSKEPYQIRRMLTETTVRASDKRAVFIGTEAYQAAGGVILRDLFQSDDGGWLQDPALLDRLVAERLRTAADAVAEEGWKWIEVAPSFSYDAMRGLRKLRAEPIDPTAEEQATIQSLNAEYRALEVERPDASVTDDVDRRLNEIQALLAAFATRPGRFDPADVARAGVFVSIAHDGTLEVERGFVRPEDEAPDPAGLNDHGSTGGERREEAEQDDTSAGLAMDVSAARTDQDDDDAIRPLPDRLVTELTAHRTLALRNALAEHPHVALTALLHTLVKDRFQRRADKGVLAARIHPVFLAVQDAALKDASSARAIEDRHRGWAGDVPVEDEALWDWLTGLEEARRLALLAHCISFGVNALFEKPSRYGGRGLSQRELKDRLAEADRLARATDLDMVKAGWRPTIGNYLGQVSKLRILVAVREGVGEQAAQRISHLKKLDMAKEAEQLLRDSGWLPEPLRHASAGHASGPLKPARDGDREIGRQSFVSEADVNRAIDDEDGERGLAIAAE